MEINQEIILQNITEGIVVQNQKGKVIYANDAAGRFLKIKDATIEPVEAHDWNGETVKFDQFPNQIALKNGKASSKVLAYKPTGKSYERWFLFKARPVKNIIISFIEDISEQITSQHQRELFLGVAGHELKTPIMSIKAFAQLAKRHPADDYFEKIDEQANRLTRIINEILDVTKIRAGKFEIRKEKIDINAVIKKVILILEPVYPAYQITAKLNAKSQIYADPERMGQVVNNLLVNAIKYSPTAKKVLITSEDKDNQVVVSVTDRGIGIPLSKQKHLFNTYYRIKTNISGNVEGLGLGLYITSSIIKAHGGKIWVKSKFGHGSTFSFSLLTSP